jgi:hypothetical protein
MSKTLLGRLLVAGSACAIASCGGGSGSSAVAFIPPPPTTKVCPDGQTIPINDPCPAAPPPSANPAIFPSVTTDTTFSALGLEASAMNTQASALNRDGYSVRYDAATKGYLIDLPSSDEFRFQSNSEDTSYWHGFAASGFYSGTIVDVFKPTSTNPEIQLTYTSFGVTTGYYSSEFGFVAFGEATPNSAVPVTGTASYDALIAGRPLDLNGLIKGNATFQFNFGAGTLSGHFDPVLRYGGVDTNLGSYIFDHTVFGVGSTSFSGALSHSGTTSLGAFDGVFTGPAAEELMSRWTAPYLNPSTQQWNEMFGVMVGKKQ